MRTITVKVYKFEELTEEAQQTAMSRLGDINVDYDWWEYDGLLDLTQEEMDKVGIVVGEIDSVLFSYKIREFDLERGQYIQFDNIVCTNDEAFRRFLEISEELWVQCAYYFENHTRNSNTHLDLHTNETPTAEEGEILDRAIEIMAEKIHSAWVSLRNQQEYLTSEEAIKDTIQANEYEFYENGKLI